MKKVTYFLLSLVLAFNLFLLVDSVKAADPATPPDDYGLSNTAAAAGIEKGSYSIQSRVGLMVGALLSLIGILFFLLALYGGILWMTARGDSSKVEKAKDIIIDAVIGLVVIGASYVITNLVFRAIGQ